MTEYLQGGEDAEWSVIDQHARAIGLLCIYMASLDNAILRLLERLLGTDERTVACITGSTPDISQRCELVRRLAHLKAPNVAWRDCVVGIMNLIQNDIAPRRNRYVHDDWYVSEDQMVRLDRRVKIRQPGAGQQPEVVHEAAKVSKLEDVYAATDKVIDCMTHLIFLGMGYSNWLRTGQQPEPPQKALDLSRYRFPTESQSDAPERMPQALTGDQ